jgi:hypothetical protein
MAGLVPAIHVFSSVEKDVDARHKAGHDGNQTYVAKLSCAIYVKADGSNADGP